MRRWSRDRSSDRGSRSSSRHTGRVLGIAARFADQWDTFAEMPGTATTA
jgi:hypothetical protein